MIRPVQYLVLMASIVLAASAAQPAFPLRLAENRRHLVDQRGTPFLYQADTPWMLFTKLPEPEAKHYIARRKEQGFAALQVQLTGFLGMTNLAGDLPFAGVPPEQDFTQPNERFFAHVDRVVTEAQRQGMLLAIAPAWSGCCGEGWAGKERVGRLKPLNANGAEKSRELGRWLGRRYGRFDNVMWILGGDNDPQNARAEIRALGLGLKEVAPRQLVTYHAASTRSSTDVWPADERWLDLSMVYSYFRGFDKAWKKEQPDIYEVSHAEFAKIPVRPFFLGESTYEGEHGEWGSALQARKQAYWCVLGGGFGHAYGSPNWNMPANWREVLELPGANSLRHLRALMESLPWWRLVPDLQNTVAVDGRGRFGSNDYAVTALADNGAFALSYLPSKRALTIDLTKLSGGRVAASWFNPRTGETSRIAEFTEKKVQTFEPPADGDWVLVLVDPDADDAGPSRSRTAVNSYYELRLYTVTSNKMDGVLERFRDTVEPVRRKYGITTVGYWSAPGSSNGGTFAYLMAAPTKDALGQQEKAFGADPQFKAGYAASNAKHGKTVDGILALPLRQDASARFDFTPTNRPRAFDLRIYSVAPGKLGAFRARWRDHAVPIYERHGLHSIGWWVADTKDSDGNDQFVCLLAGESLDAVQRSIAAFHADSGWQRVERETEQQGKLRTGVTAYKLLPADFSFLK